MTRLLQPLQLFQETERLSCRRPRLFHQAAGLTNRPPFREWHTTQSALHDHLFFRADNKNVSIPTCKVTRTLDTPALQFSQGAGVKCRPAVGAAADPAVPKDRLVSLNIFTWPPPRYIPAGEPGQLATENQALARLNMDRLTRPLPHHVQQVQEQPDLHHLCQL